MKEEKNAAEVNLMISVLACQLKDYLNGIRGPGYEARGRARIAKEYISSNDVSYIFSFNFICLSIGIDPFRFKKKILNIQTSKDLNEVYRRLKSFR